MGLFSKKKSEVAQDTNTNLQKIKDDIEEEIEGLESKIKEKNERLDSIGQKEHQKKLWWKRLRNIPNKKAFNSCK